MYLPTDIKTLISKFLSATDGDIDQCDIVGASSASFHRKDPNDHNMRFVERLVLIGNPCTRIPQMPFLKKLNLSASKVCDIASIIDCNLDELNVSFCYNLNLAPLISMRVKKLVLAENNLASCDVLPLSLEDLSVSRINMRINLKKHINIKRLVLSTINSTFVELPINLNTLHVCRLPLLQHLRLPLTVEHLRISNLSIAEIHNLELLNLKTLYVFRVPLYWLPSFENLSRLELEDTQITHIDECEFPALVEAIY